REFNKPRMEIAPDALRALIEYDWPGNVREIRNCIERAVLLAEGDLIRLQDISILRPNNAVAISANETPSAQNQKNLSTLALTEREMILDALRKNDWVQKDAAAMLGISKRVIHYKIKKYGITHPRWIKNR
ncbi:MAG TPA: helix-turn-helix domain-containing protein, partial [Deltaproteobacteria bacterium]|nr:helix-turn-helix domain-containing protein [Deltaproteobacteria bacterium]